MTLRLFIRWLLALIVGLLIVGQPSALAQEPFELPPVSSEFAGGQPPEATDLAMPMVPRHQPGYPAKVAPSAPAARGQGRSLDRLLVDGVLADPFAGNYTLVSLDQITVGWAGAEGTTFLHDTNWASIPSDPEGTFELIDPITTIEGSLRQAGSLPAGDKTPFDIAGGDFNGDNWAEQVLAWPNAEQGGQLYLTVGQHPAANGKFRAGPAVAMRDGEIEFFVGDLLHALRFRRGGPGAEWQTLAGPSSDGLAAGLALTPISPDTLKLFTVGEDRRLYTADWAGGATLNWEGHAAPSGASLQIEPPAAVTTEAGGVKVFARAGDNTLWLREFDGSVWLDWQSLGGFVTTSPAVTAYGSNRVALFARGFDDALWYRFFDGEAWQGWQTLPALADLPLAAPPAAVSTAPGRIELMAAAGNPTTLYWTRYEAGTWSTPQVIDDFTARELGAVARAGGEIDLYGRSPRGRLHHWSFDGATWTPSPAIPNGEGLPAQGKTTPTTIVPAADLPLDVATAYILGNGHDQVVVASGEGSQVRLTLFEVAPDFGLVQVDAILDSAVLAQGKQFAVATGDFLADGDGFGFDEIALFMIREDDFLLRVYDLDAGRKLAPAGDLVLDAAHFKDLDLDPNFPYSPDDLEKVFGRRVSLVAGQIESGPETLFLGYSARLKYDRTAIPSTNIYAGFVTPITVEGNFAQGPTIWVEGGDPLHLSLAAGDLTGVDTLAENLLERRDELLVGYPSGSLVAYEVTDTLQLVELGRTTFPRPGDPFTVAVGDLDRNLQDEAVLVGWLDDNQKVLHSYVLDGDQLTQAGERVYEATTTSNRHLALAVDDFVARSMRVGPPTHRVERRVVDIIAAINRPPTHRDRIDGQWFDINTEDRINTFGAFETEEGTKTEMTITHTRKWAISTGVENEILPVFKSLTATYGDNFEQTTSQINSVTYGREIKADRDDALIFTTTDYNVWEYPLYAETSDLPLTHILVMFPIEINEGSGDFTQQRVLSGTACDSWYQPTHQRFNAWSYPDLNQPQYLTGFTDGTLLLTAEYEVAGVTQLFSRKWEEIQVEKRSSTVSKKIESELEASLPFGFKLTVLGNYEVVDTSTHKVSGTEKTVVTAKSGSIADQDAHYTVQPYLYWTEAGHLMLDYASQPDDLPFWQRYNRPDPAFILPWRDTSCPDDRAELSPDVVIEPPVADLGETITISATVRNFSAQAEEGIEVPVRFYAGDPDRDGDLIGQAMISALPRAAGPQTAAIRWTVDRPAVERIYAVIDPDNLLPEMHDERHGIDNNKGFGQLEVGTGAYLDPGTGQDYRALQLRADNPTGMPAWLSHLTLDVYIPLGHLAEVQRFALLVQPGSPGLLGETFGAPFVLQAHDSQSVQLDFTFNSTETIPVGLLDVRYDDAEPIQEGLETDVDLYIWGEGAWEIAGCDGASPLRLVKDNRLVFPICRTGIYALAAQQPTGVPWSETIYLPVTLH